MQAGSSPQSIAVGDFNADLDPDLAVANSTSSTVSIYLGGLAGAFAAPATITVPGGAGAVAVGDFDQNGDPDLAVSGTSGTVSTFLGVPMASTFTTGQTMTAGNFPTDVAVGDFDGNADPDIVVANQGGDNLSIFAGADAARFIPTPVTLPAGDAPNSIAIGNFNAGTDPDLAVTNQGQLSAPAADNVSILVGNDAPSIGFSGPTNFTVGDFPQDVTTADFNRDGDLDLAVANVGSGTGGPLSTSILTGTGVGAGFAAAGTLSGGGRAVEVGDFNADGDPDLAAGGASVNNLSIFVGAGGAAFGAAQNFTFGGDVLSVAVADFNADKLPDVVGANLFANQVTTALNTSDLTAPDTTIQTGPTGPTNDNTPTFTFTANEAGSTFQCRVVGVTAFAPCTSPYTPAAAIADGARTVEVLATDAAGNVETVAASRSFTVDTAAPTVTFLTGPTGPTSDNTPEFTFSVSEAAALQCRVVGVTAFAPCTSPYTPAAAIADGARTVEVQATDAAGNVGTGSRTFTVDASAPETSLTSGPSGPTNDPTPTFAFSSPEPGATFQCKLDNAPAFTACTSPHTTATLADGTHTFEVRALDAQGNADATAVTRTFVVDTKPPETKIDSGPSGPVEDDTPTFVFSSSEPGAKFQCKLDDSPFIPCTSPLTLPKLSPGSHTFQVRSIDAAGNVDASPSSSLGAEAALRSFTVRAAAPDPPVYGRSFNVEPVKGDVFVSLPPGTARASISARASVTVPGIKGRNFIPLREARQVPVGSLLDTRKGTVRLISARNRNGVTQASEFVGGVFQVLQSGKTSAKGLTELRLKGASFAGCRSSKGKRATAAASKRRIRRLRGNGRGRFRTRGRYSSATVRGTIWTVTDRCDGTLTKVTRGRVAVRDLRKRKTRILRAGKSYLARAPR